MYVANRKIVLQGNPNCAFCGKGGANTVDHIIPFDAGGGDDLDNLRPAHQVCNSRAGAAYVNAKRARQGQIRAKALHSKENQFFGDARLTDRKSVV